MPTFSILNKIRMYVQLLWQFYNKSLAQFKLEMSANRSTRTKLERNMSGANGI